MNGILNLNKPAGWTSHDVVAWVRRLLKIKRVGHAGTLDPLATGVLLVCVGQATRVAEYLMASPKSYRAKIRLGVITDTYDSEGMIVSTVAVPDLTTADLHRELVQFVGNILQTPPAFSAIKQDGIPLHRRARRGEVVQPAPRPITIHRIELLDWQTPYLEIAVDCDPGTYIRSLAYDLGQALGCGATLAALIRTRSGNFTLEEALTTEALAEATAAGQISSHLHPLQTALGGFTTVTVSDAEVEALRHGQAISCPDLPPVATGYALAPNGAVAAILTYDAGRCAWRPDKVFSATDEA